MSDSETKAPIEALAAKAADLCARPGNKLFDDCYAGLEHLGLDFNKPLTILKRDTEHDSDPEKLILTVKESGHYFSPFESTFAQAVKVQYYLKNSAGTEGYFTFYLVSRQVDSDGKHSPGVLPNSEFGRRLFPEPTETLRERMAVELKDFPEYSKEELAEIVSKAGTADNWQLSKKLGLADLALMESNANAQSRQLANVIMATTAFITTRFLIAR